jgi:hypothetical protein
VNQRIPPAVGGFEPHPEHGADQPGSGSRQGCQHGEQQQIIVRWIYVVGQGGLGASCCSSLLDRMHFLGGRLSLTRMAGAM